MDRNDLLKDLKKIDLSLIKKSDIRIFENEKIAVEYYNDAVDNILEGNTDIASIKLKKVLSLSPDFSEAAQLLERLNDYDNIHSIGDKIYESMHGRDINFKKLAYSKRNLPQMLNINPRALLKIIIVLIVIALTIAASIMVIKLLDKEPGVTENNNEVTYSQEEVNALNKRIDELEDNLAKSETETQEALSASTGNQALIEQLEEERDALLAERDLYRAAVLFEQEKFVLSADIAKGLDAEAYKGAEKELYHSVYNKAIFQAADSLYKIGLSLYSQKDFTGAVENLERVDEYAPEFEELGNCYYVLAKAYYELNNAAKSIELYEYIDMNIPTFENETGLLYYTGKAYQKLNRYDKAREMYNLLISGYPDSTLVGYAKDRLKEMLSE